MSRPSSTAARNRRPMRRAFPCSAARWWPMSWAARRVKSVHLDRRHAHQLRCGRHVRRLEPHRQPRLPSRREADVGCESPGLPAARQWARPSRSRVRPPAGCCSPNASPMARPRVRWTASPSTSRKCRDEAFAISPLWWVKESHGKAFIDYQNDSTAKDLPLAAREGYTDVELAKRYTTTGMATDQGKLGNVNAIAILAEATGRTHGRGGHHHLPALLHAGLLRRLRRPLHRPPLPAGAQDAAA